MPSLKAGPLAQLAKMIGAIGADLAHGTAPSKPVLGELVHVVTDLLQQVAPAHPALPALNMVAGTTAADNLFGTANADHITGIDGNDTIHAGAGNDIVSGGIGNDMLFGEAGHDLVSGGDGDDVLDGGADSDLLIGGLGNDKLDGGSGDDVLDGGPGRDVLIGGEGRDVASYAHADAAVTINLLDATGNSNAGEALGDTFNGVEAFTLTRFDDSFTDNAAGATVYGGPGADTLIAGAGADVFYGGPGVDRFVFAQAGSAVAGVVDKIMDFRSGEKIDLSRIDAVAGGADNAFTFVDTKAFSGAAGELRVESTKDGWLVTGDVNGDKTADFQILVAGNHHPVVADFVL